jgi:FSR family fosmidomycin resistance protein-like MFS transporter
MNLKGLVLLIIGHLVMDIHSGALPAFLPFVKESLNLSYTLTASIILVVNVTSSIIQPGFGYFSDRRSADWLLPMGCVVASLGLSALGFCPSYAWLLVFSALCGLGQASYHPEGFKLVNLLGGSKKASAISLFLVGGHLGFSLGPFLATLFFKYFDLKGTVLFLPLGVMMAAIFLATSYWKGKHNFTTTQLKDFENPIPPKRRLIPIILLLLVVILRQATRLGLLIFIPFYIINILHRDPLIAGEYLSAFLLVGTAGSLTGGPVADRFGYKKTIIFSMGLTSIFLQFFFYTSGLWSLIFFLAAGFTLVFSNAVTMAMGQSLMPENLGMASGLILGLSMGVGGIGTTVLGWVADNKGLPFTLHIIFLFPLLGFLLCFLIQYPSRR